MTKKHFIALAEIIKQHNDISPAYCTPFTKDQIETLADFCAQQNSHFNRSRWLAYIAGEVGPNGGTPKGK